MCNLGINGEGELRGQLVNPGSPGKWPLKWSVRVFHVLIEIHAHDNSPTISETHTVTSTDPY